MMPSSKSATKPKSSQTAKPVWEWSFSAIGTEWWLGIYDEGVQADTLQQRILALIEDFDVTYSRFRADSVVTHMSKEAGSHQLPANTAPLLTLYRQLYEVTDGRVTPLVGQLLSDAGYDANYSLTPSSVLSEVPAWDSVMSVDGATIVLQQPALLDFGAAGKGYLVDLISQLLKNEGLQQFCIDASGDMYCYGQSLTVGLENPADAGSAIGVVYLQDRALCGSAPNRRAWTNYHHIMDPSTQKSVSTLKAVWVTADSAMLADGLTTALFFATPEILRKHFKFEYALVYADGSLRYSPHFPATFFTKENS